MEVCFGKYFHIVCGNFPRKDKTICTRHRQATLIEFLEWFILHTKNAQSQICYITTTSIVHLNLSFIFTKK